MIHESLAEHGFVAPIIVNRSPAAVCPKTHGRIVAGHGRYYALVQLQKKGEKPPARVEVQGREWLVPCVLVPFASDSQAERYQLIDNRATEAASWDEPSLAKMLLEIAKEEKGLKGTGFDEDSVDQILKDIAQDNDEEQDDIPALPKIAISKPGDVWILGEHRLLCGDSTKVQDVKRVMGKDRALLMATDPPYGVAYGDETGSKKYGKIANDENDGPKLQAFLEACFRAAVSVALDKHAAWYLWHAQLTQGFFAAAAAAAAAAAVKIHRQIIWVKPSLILGHGDYHWKHELCFYGWVSGSRPPFYGKRNQTTVWELGNETAQGKRVHPTQKPVALWDAPIHNHTKPGQVLYEPFNGSGTQIIAAEKTSRRCRAIEIEPGYVDVAVERWEKFTRGKATRQKG